MSLIDEKKVGRRKPWGGLGLALAGLGWLGVGFCASAQVTVDTIGGGVRVECKSTSGFAGGNTWTNAQFNAPYSSALDTNGNLWIADKGNSDIEQLTQAGNKGASQTIEYYTTTGVSPHFVTNYHAFTNVSGVAVDPANNLYVLLPSPPQVFKASLATESTSLNLLSVLNFTNYPSDAIATAMVVDGHSNVFIAFTNGAILRVQMVDSNPPPTVYQENYAIGASPAVEYIVSGAFAWQPTGMALMPNGQLAVSDTLNNAIWTVSTNGYASNSNPQLLAGGHGAGFDDGGPSFAQFNQPHGLAAAANGDVIVCDLLNNRVRVIDTASNTTTLYGTASNVWATSSCCSCDPAIYPGWLDGLSGITSTNAESRQPVSVTISSSNALFVTELYYSIIREVTNSPYAPVNVAATAPVAVTEPSSGTSSTNATLNGTVNPGGSSTYYFFEWGTNAGYGNFTTTNLLTNNLTATQNVSATLLNLAPGTTYHYQLVAFNGVGYSYGGDASFVAPAEPPIVSTQPATGVTNNIATLNANVDPDYSATTVYFQYGPTTNYGFTTPLINLTSNLTTTQPVSSTVSNLQLGSLYYFQAVAVNSGGTVFGNQLVFSTAYVPPPTLSFSPSNGYFPECVTISVTSSVATVYFTTNGVAPTTNSAQVPMTASGGGFVGTIDWCNPQENLSQLQLLAGTGTNVTVVSGGFTSTNLVGFPQPLAAGPGEHLYVPVVVDLQSNTALQSLQFRVEITPTPPNTNMIASLQLQPLTPNDFVPLPGPAPGDAPVAFQTFTYTTASNGQGLVITASGNSSGLDMTGSGVVVLLHFQVPPSVLTGQTYSLTVLSPSGTSDGQQATVGLSALGAQTLTISDPPYLVGDSSPSTGYNAGQFGNGALDNSDVNNAIYASVNIRVPPSDSDAYNSMDAFPPDSAGHGGDTFITMLDWETILSRSLGGVPITLGLDTNNYIRFWTNGDTSFPSHAVVDWYPGGPPVPLDADAAPVPNRFRPNKLATSNTPPGLVWFCEASVGSGTIASALPGNTYNLPVYAKVLPGYSLAALQFRTIVTGSAGAPAVTSIQFNPASGMPSPQVLPGLAGNDKVDVWGFGSFSTPLQNSNYLGTVSFTVPSGATPGMCYSLHFVGVDGAPGAVLYQLESFPGSVWVMSSALQPASITSDEWKTAFFGSLTNSQATDNVDADGDGSLNWQEYVAGTDPTNPLSRLQFSSANLYNNGLRGVAINWVTAPGKTYILQSSPKLSGGAWTSINTNNGDGNDYQCIVTNLSGSSQFYQIRLHE